MQNSIGGLFTCKNYSILSGICYCYSPQQHKYGVLLVIHGNLNNHGVLLVIHGNLNNHGVYIYIYMYRLKHCRECYMENMARKRVGERQI